MKEIKLTKGKVAKVDDDMYDFLSQWKWTAYKNRAGNWYAVRSVHLSKTQSPKTKSIAMHRVVLGTVDAPYGVFCDHIDHDGLNNQRSNLRKVTKQQNQQNARSHKDASSKYMGVARYNKTNRWRAEISKDRKRIHLGIFNTEEEAAIARDKAAMQIFGEYAHLNILTKAA